MAEPLTTIVVPTVGRRSLRVLLNALASGTVPPRGPVIVVDDRSDGADRAGELSGLALPGLRVVRSGGGGPARAWVSVRQQAGNADDFLMRALHGPDWPERAGAPRGRRGRHAAVTAASGVVAVAALLRRPRIATAAALAAVAGIADLAWARIGPGPRDREEVRRLLLTSAVIPFAATWHSARGAWLHRRAEPSRGLPDLVLFDRDGTLVHDVAYNGDPDAVAPVDGARESLDRLRALGVRVGVVTNQSGVGSGLITLEQAEAVNRRVEDLLGPFDVWRLCPHARGEGCGCRKPAPGMVKDACAALDVDAARCVLVGDIGSDVAAAQAAGARAVLVPAAATRAEEVWAAEHVTATLAAAVDDILAGRW